MTSVLTSARPAPKASAPTTFAPKGPGFQSPGLAGPAWRRWVALVVLMLPVLLVSVDNTVLSFALPQISAALAPSGSQLLWIVDIYPLVLAGLLVPMGSLADRLGRRRVLLVGAVGFAAVSAVAAFAPTAGALVAARAGLGFFGAMLMPSTLSLLRSVFTDREERRLAIAVWAAGFAAGSAVGPIVGGVLLEHFWWGSVFLLAVPVLALLLATAPVFVPESRDPEPGRLDPLSVVLVMGAMVPVVYGIKSLAADGVTALTLAVMAAGVGAGVAFVRRQLRRPDPMLDVRLFAVPAFTGSVLVNLLSVFSLVGFLFFVSQDLQLVIGLSPVEAGTALLPGTVVMVVAGLAVVRVVRRVRPAHVVAAGLGISAVGYLVTALVAGRGEVGWISFAFVVLALGIGAAETVSNDLVVSTVPAAKAGAASAISETAYEIGAVLGTAVLGGILTASYAASVVVPRGVSAADAATAVETLGGATTVAAGLSAGRAQALLDSAHAAFGSGVVLTSAIGFVAVVIAAGIALATLRDVRS
ncbi:MFS transporter [Isoptericola sp. NEAU-Y5]|uniref:MFS transporter n=1 Tax=Isoptericola luteus TaxID=2879484 RepID=A0ABS7ZIZ4_9MICO|nr:MFS transporter [Isoptericola sp. NEAU-Y5]MCA5893750.1 MFS transporter [Isoptericola sp. NEAU-Y5]